jgi:hypothetical protein
VVDGIMRLARDTPVKVVAAGSKDKPDTSGGKASGSQHKPEPAEG